MGPPPRKLLERVRETIQRKHYAIEPETASEMAAPPPGSNPNRHQAQVTSLPRVRMEAG